MSAALANRRAGSGAMARSTMATSDGSSPGRTWARGTGACASTARSRPIGVSPTNGLLPDKAS